MWGSSNRLVIPKKDAVKYFPRVSKRTSKQTGKKGAAVNDVELVSMTG